MATDREIIAALAEWYSAGANRAPIIDSMFDDDRTWGEVVAEAAARPDVTAVLLETLREIESYLIGCGAPERMLRRIRADIFLAEGRA